MKRIFWPTFLVLIAGACLDHAYHAISAHDWWGLAPLVAAIALDLTGLTLLERMVKE